MSVQAVQNLMLIANPIKKKKKEIDFFFFYTKTKDIDDNQDNHC